MSNIEIEKRPNSAGPATEVATGMRFLDVSNINDIDQTVTVDFAVFMRWVDPRLKRFAGCQVELKRVWHPDWLLMNSGQTSRYFPVAVQISSDGVVHYKQRFEGTLTSSHRLNKFPFDDRLIRLSISTYSQTADALKLVVDTKSTGRAERVFTSPAWSFGDATAHVGEYFVEVYGWNSSRYDLEVTAVRATGYFIWRIIVPVIFIVAMSWATFWISPIQFGPQIGLSATSMLTLIAFQLAMGRMLPQVNYLTTIDKFIAGSTIIVFFAFIVSLTTIFLVSKEQEEMAFRFDRVSRFLFPLIYVVFVIIIFYD